MHIKILANLIAHQNVIKNSFNICPSSATKHCFKLLNQLYKSPSSYCRQFFYNSVFHFNTITFALKVFIILYLWHFQHEKNLVILLLTPVESKSVQWLSLKYQIPILEHSSWLPNNKLTKWIDANFQIESSWF